MEGQTNQGGLCEFYAEGVTQQSLASQRQGIGNQDSASQSGGTLWPEHFCSGEIEQRGVAQERLVEHLQFDAELVSDTIRRVIRKFEPETEIHL